MDVGGSGGSEACDGGDVDGGVGYILRMLMNYKARYYSVMM